MIQIDRPGRLMFVSQYMFSTIADNIRYQIVWRQYIDMEGKVRGIGQFLPQKGSHIQDRALPTAKSQYITDHIMEMNKDRLRKAEVTSFEEVKRHVR